MTFNDYPTIEQTPLLVKKMAAGLGFEPRLTDPESVGLPLADPAIYLYLEIFSYCYPG